MTNDEKLERIKKRKILLVFIVIFGIATVTLALLSILIKLTPIPAIITFLIEAILSKYRDKLDPKEAKTDSKNQE